MTTYINPATAPQDDGTSFIQTVFAVKLVPGQGDSSTGVSDANGDFATYAQIIGYSAMTDSTDNGGSISNIIPDPTIAKILTQSNNTTPEYFYSQSKCRDTTIGGNDAINCYPQFNETDDVAEHPFFSTIYPDSSGGQSGMGRVYSETYDDLQQIMYITFGVPEYNNLSSFYTNAILSNPNLAKIMNDGGLSTASEIETLVGNGIGFFIALPVLPLVFIYNVLNTISNIQITKYYDFKSAMPLYYRCVNSMIQHLAVNMGLTQDNFLLFGMNPTTQSGESLDNTLLEKASNAANANLGSSTNGLPDIFKKYGFDIYAIMLAKYQYGNGGTLGTNLATIAENNSDYSLLNNPTDTTTTAPTTATTTSKSFTSDFISSFMGQLYDASLYIGFRVEKGIDTSETFTNETGESNIAQEVNSRISSIRSTEFSLGEGNITGAISSVVKAIGNVLSGIADVADLGGVKSILAGSGFIDFPDVWKSSSFSKSYSFNMHLRSPYGDPVSILQNLYIPLSLLYGGAMPRAIGQAAYTAPFLCRAYCKGMFAVPLGMITNITVKRGADQFGWNTARLPTCVDVSFEIKDLSPAMYMAIGQDGTSISGITNAIQAVFGTNSNYQEYLMTLSGMGLKERLNWLQQLRLKASYLLAQVTTTKLSPFYWGATFGASLPARVISSILPNTKLPTN